MCPGNRTAGTGNSRGAMSETVDPAIIGAGPAGMSAATASCSFSREARNDVVQATTELGPVEVAIDLLRTF